MKDIPYLSEYFQGTTVVNVFIVSLFLFYMFFVQRNTIQNFFIGITCVVIAIIMYNRNQKIKREYASYDTYIDTIEKRMVGTVLSYDNIYQIHKAPKTLKFVRRSRDLKKLIYELRHYLLYDEEAFIKFVCLIEYFLKYHFLILTKKYEYELYYPVMKDIRRNMINHLFSMYYNFPKYSTVKDVPDMQEYLYKRIMYIQSYTYRYMKILNNKYAASPVHVPPFGIDGLQDQYYSVI